MGIEENEPLKWNFGQTSKVRRRIEESGWTNRERRRLVLEAIRELPITLLADVLYDVREEERSPLDFYRYALDWLVLRFRNYITDLNPRPAGPHFVVLDKPSPTSAIRGDWIDYRYQWLKDREQIWHVHYQQAYLDGFRFPGRRVPPLSEAGFYPSALVSHAKFNPMLEIADAVAGLALDFVDYNLHRAEADRLPDIDWKDEQLIRVARKFRARATGDIYRWGFAVFPEGTPAVKAIGDWVRILCTHSDHSELRDL